MSYDVENTVDRVRERIERACAGAGRDPSEVKLIAVSKAHPEEAVRAAYAAGLRVFGENYAQELGQKAAALSDLSDIEWRFIGHLQRNKIKLIERARATVDTVDSIRLAEAISARAAGKGSVVELLLQVNVGGEAQKSGCAPKDVADLVRAVRALPNVELRGLMTVAPH
ncbi:MAG: YggS family pyridoxal phosphate-dependent enzyme, partial [Myxococcales bacterium]